MSLDVRRLEKARELAGGIVQARCPACASRASVAHLHHTSVDERDI